MAAQQQPGVPAPRSASFQAQLLSAVSQAVVATDLDGVITHWNPAAEALYGWKASEVLGRNVVDVTPSDVSRDHARAIMTALSRGQTWAGEFEVQRKDGSRFLALVRDSPVYGDGGELVGIVGVSEDITSRRNAEAALHAARAQLAHVEKLAAMGSLVSGVAHEIRTPLAYAQTSLFVLQARAAQARKDGAPFADPGELIQPALDGLERIGGIVEALRRFTRLDEAQRVAESLHGLVGESMRLMRATHPSGVNLVGELDATPVVRLNRLQMQQVTLNLMENALDASVNEVRVLTQHVADGARLVVEDDGPGIAKDLAEKVFDEFFTTKEEGTGLGLAIVRRIVSEHGGRVWHEPREADDPGSGTRFVVELPAAAPPAREQSAE